MRSREYTIGTGITQRQILEVSMTPGEDDPMEVARLFPQYFVECSPEATDQLELFDPLDYGLPQIPGYTRVDNAEAMLKVWEEQVLRDTGLTISTRVDDALAELKVRAEQVLKDAGLPVSVHHPVRLLPDGSWRDDLPDLIPCTITITTTMALVREGDGIDSEEWYAAQFCYLLGELQRARESTDWQQALYAAWMIGRRETELRLKARWDRPAMAGDLSLKGASESGKARKDTTKSGLPKAERDAAVSQIAADIRQKNPNLSDWSLAKCLEQHPNNTTWRIGQRQIYRIVHSS